MTEEANPYNAPRSDIDTAQETHDFQVHDPSLVSIDKGVSWIGGGFSLFKQAPGDWILICIVGFILMIVLNLIPLLGIVMGITTPVWTAGLMIGCKALHNNERLKLNHLFAGFKDRVWTLLGLGALTMVSTFGILALAIGSVYLEIASGNFENALTTATMVKALLALALLIPVMAAAWFAPPLIVLGRVPLFKALKLSLIGCFKNFLPFLIYGIILFILSIVAAIPLALGYLVLGPLFYGSLFTSFKDIYVD